MRFVISRCEGKPDTVIMSTDLSLTPREIAGLYADRFAIELTFRELKQHFGLGEYQVRTPQGMLRHLHLSAVACALTQLLTLQAPTADLTDGAKPVKPTPWRGAEPVRSVRETQLLLRLACEAAGAFCDVAPDGKHREKPPRLSTPPRHRKHDFRMC